MIHRRLALAVPLSCACLSACIDAAELDAPVAETRHEQIMLNQLPLGPILLNSLIGMPANLGQLVSKPLRSDSFDVGLPGGALGLQLLDPDAKVFMKYLVRCALAPEDPPVTWDHPLNASGTQSWHGQLGLCSDWADAAPSSECLELVSACLLAAENAEGKSIATSQRGLALDGTALPLTDEVTVKTLDETGLRIDSFGACPTATAGALRDCGWSADASLVGVCTPGENVALQCDAGSSSGVVRICQGHTGCDHDSASMITADPDMCGATDQIAFACPASGSYAVMAGGPQSSDPVALGLHASAGQFPASELEVFDRREGAYFGSLLAPGSRSTAVYAYVDPSGAVHRNVPPGVSLVVNLSMWACHDIDWLTADAYASHRLCALVKDSQGETATLCAARSLGACHDPGDERLPGDLVCAVDDTAVRPGDGDFDDCTDTYGNLWTRPITVYLDHPCDLTSREWQRKGLSCPDQDARRQ